VRRLTVALASVLLSLGLATPAASVHALEARAETGFALEPVPYPMDSTNQAGWWNPLAEHEGTTYFAFDAPAVEENLHEVHIAKRSADGVWTSGCLKASDGSCVRYNDDIGHHQPSIAIDGKGYIHAFVSMHGSRWRYFRSDAPGSVTTMTDHSSEMPDQEAGVTYPTTTAAPNGDVFVIARVTVPETGSSGTGRLYQWDVERGVWQRVAIFAYEAGFSVYPDQIQTDRLGRVHLIWEWARAPASGIRHLGSYLIYDPRRQGFLTPAAQPIDVPVTTEAPADMIYQPLEGEESKQDGTSSIDPGVQSAKLTLLRGSVRPGAVAYRYRPAPGALFQIRWAEWDGHRWVRETVYDGDLESEAAVGATYARNVARVYYTFKAPLCDPGTTTTGGLFVAEKRLTGSSRQWTERLLDAESGIYRLATHTRGDGTDVLYLAAPNIDDPPASRLYFATLPRGTASGVTESSMVARGSALAADDSTNWAYDAEVSVSSALTEQSGGKCAVDGNRTDRNSRWISARGDATPSITLTLRQPIEVGRVDVYSGYFSDSLAIVRDFTVELFVDGSWQTVAEVSGNTENPVSVEVSAGVVTDRVRLVLTDPSGYTGGSDLARIFEIEIYAA